MEHKFTGFTFPINSLETHKQIDCFCITNRKNKCKSLFNLIIRKLNNIGYQLPDNASVYDALNYWTAKAYLIEHESYYSISGNNFGTCIPKNQNEIIILDIDN